MKSIRNCGNVFGLLGPRFRLFRTRLVNFSLPTSFLVASLCWLDVSASIPAFDPAVEISPSGSDGATASESGDFDNDGRAEFVSIATSSSSDAHFRIYDYAVVSGGFTVHTVLSDSEVDSRADRFGGDIAIADMDMDGFVDIVVPSSRNSGDTGSLSWFENPDGNLSGTWVEHGIETWSGSGTGEVVAHMSEVDVGDIDGDGRLDVVTRDVSHGVFVVLQLSDGTGWRPKRFIPTNPREGLDLFNPDGDADLDIVLNGVWLETPSDPLSGTYVLHAYGSDWYPSGNTTAEISDYASQIAIADFNDDGRDDIAITNSEELSNSSSTDSKPKGIEVFLAPQNPKTQAWTKVVAETEHFSWHSLEPADLDGDGAVDFVSAISDVGKDSAPAEIVAFMNNGAGTGFTKIQLPTSGSPTLVYNSTLADADGDGDADLFAPNAFASGPMRYYENSTAVRAVEKNEFPSLVKVQKLDTGLELTFNGLNSDFSYRLLQSEDLLVWTEIVNGFVPSSSLGTIVISTISNGKVFYVLEIENN